MKSQMIIFFGIVMLYACYSPRKSGITQQPILADYQVGEKWVWKYKGVSSEGEIRSEGEDTREIVRIDSIRKAKYQHSSSWVGFQFRAPCRDGDVLLAVYSVYTWSSVAVKRQFIFPENFSIFFVKSPEFGI